MNILYIEDDLIDQMSFKRLAEKFNARYTILKSIEAVKKHFETPQQYDLIVSDYFLADGNANEIVEFLPNQKIIVLAEEDKIHCEYNPELVSFTLKPLTGNVFHTNEKIVTIDLKYFNELVGDDKDFQIEMIDTALQSLPESLSKIQTYMNEHEFEKIKFEVHKMKSGVRVFGINILEDITYAESIALQKNEKVLFPILEKLIVDTNKALDLIKAEKNNL